MEHYYNPRFNPADPSASQPEGGCFCQLFAIIVALLLCALLGSCKSREMVVKEKIVYDTVWTVKVVHDSVRGTVLQREITKITPHVIRLRDTVIVYSDTSYISNTDTVTYIFHNYYQDSGRVVHDTLWLSGSLPEKPKSGTYGEQRAPGWLITGACVALATGLLYFIIRNRKKVVCFIRRLASRHK